MTVIASGRKTLDRDWIIRSVHNLWFGERASPGCLYPIAV